MCLFEAYHHVRHHVSFFVFQRFNLKVKAIDAPFDEVIRSLSREALEPMRFTDLLANLILLFLEPAVVSSYQQHSAPSILPCI